MAKIIDGKANKCKMCVRAMRYQDGGKIHYACIPRSRGAVCNYRKKEGST